MSASQQPPPRPEGWTRRHWLVATPLCVGGVALAQSNPHRATPPVRFGLNTSTLRGQQLALPELIDLAARAGYDAIEPWIGELEAYQRGGGKLEELRRRLADHGLSVPSAIGFATWIVDDPQQRQRGLEQMRRDMQWIQAIGGTGIAAPPAGATRQQNLDLRQAARRYRDLLDLGASLGVTPHLEFWGSSACMNRLADALYVAAEAGHPRATILPDIYHLYKGNSSFDSLHLLSSCAVQVFHMNDYPAVPDRQQITDAHRVFPGDGVAPLEQVVRTLLRCGFRGTLSLELFNRQYWERDPLEVARIGLERMREITNRAWESLSGD